MLLVLVGFLSFGSVRVCLGRYHTDCAQAYCDRLSVKLLILQSRPFSVGRVLEMNFCANILCLQYHFNTTCPWLLYATLTYYAHRSIDLIHERVIVRLRHSLPDGKLQKEEWALCFTAGLL